METIKDENNKIIRNIIENGGNITALLTMSVTIVALFLKFYFYIADLSIFIYYNIDIRFLNFNRNDYIGNIIIAIFSLLLFYLGYFYLSKAKMNKKAKKYYIFNLICNIGALVTIYINYLNLLNIYLLIIYLLISVISQNLLIKYFANKKMIMKNMIGRLDKKLSFQSTIFILIMIIFLNMGNSYYMCATQKKFLVLENKNEIIVYNDGKTFITKKFQYDEHNKIVIDKSKSYLYDSLNGMVVTNKAF